MEHKFNASTIGIDLKPLRDFCMQHGETVSYGKGEQLEREGEPARWFAYVERGCFKYVTRGMSDGRDHLTWFSFEGEFVADYPSLLHGSPAVSTIQAMMPSRICRVEGEKLMAFFCRSSETLLLRAVIGEHMLSQFKARYQDFHRATPRERYDLLMRRCPGIVNELPLNAIASFLNVTPKTISLLRRDIALGK